MRTIEYKDVKIGEEFTVFDSGNKYIKGQLLHGTYSVCIDAKERYRIATDGKFVDNVKVQVDRPLTFQDLKPGDEFYYGTPIGGTVYIKTEPAYTSTGVETNAISRQHGRHCFIFADAVVTQDEVPF